jgi:prepilin-type N-terminal cleavage/methylation domain-containing protein
VSRIESNPVLASGEGEIMRRRVTDPNCEFQVAGGGRRIARGFTLLEVLVAVTITLILMGLVVEIFSRVSTGVNNSRANMELNDQLRNAKHRLIMDLRGVTAPMTPPLEPMKNLGYFEYVEGPRVASSQFTGVLGTSGGDMGMDVGPLASNSNMRVVNSVIGDTDDLLMFTTSSFDGEMFVGKGGFRPTSSSIAVGAQSRYAEVAWFLRRTQFVTSLRNDNHAEFFNLHRRTWLILPDGVPFGGQTYQDADISMSSSGGNYGPTELPPNTYIDPKTARRAAPGGRYNSLGDLTKRECRSVHQPYKWPFEMMYVVSAANSAPGLPAYGNVFWNPAFRDWDRFQYMSLPTLAEQSAGHFPGPSGERTSGTGPAQIFVPKNAPSPGLAPNDIMFANAITTPTNMLPGMSEGARIGEDIILTNVTSFDIKAWDPGAPVFAAPMADSTAAAVSPIASVLVPGDPGYIPAVDRFIGTPSNVDFQPVGFGAYADLNYMGTDTIAADHRKRWYAYGGTGGGALQAMAAAPPYSNKSKLPQPAFAHPGEGALSGMPITVKGSGFSQFPAPRPCVYDTWSTHYEFDGMNNDPEQDDDIDEFTNGADDNGNGLIDEPNAYNNEASSPMIITGEQDAPPPYRSPLRGIKITIRVMELDSKQVREVTVVQEFIPL